MQRRLSVESPLSSPLWATVSGAPGFPSEADGTSLGDVTLVKPARGTSTAQVLKTALLSLRRLLQLKVMEVVAWPVGDPNFEIPSSRANVDDLSIRIVESPEVLEAMLRDRTLQITKEDWQGGNFSAKLSQWQNAVLAFSGNELVHVTWFADTPEAIGRLVVDPPFYVTEPGVCIVSGVYTSPRYRGLGVYPCVLCWLLSMQRAAGARWVYASVFRKNASGCRSLETANALHAARCLRLRIRIPRRSAEYIPLITWKLGPRDVGRHWIARRFTVRPEGPLTPFGRHMQHLEQRAGSSVTENPTQCHRA